MNTNKKLSLNLNKYNVDVNDSTLYSPYFFNIIDIESEFGYGKNLIRLSPNYNVINRKLDILIDILDSNGNTLYYTISQKSLNDKSRLISVFVDESVLNGAATITFVATTLDNKVVRYNHSIVISKKTITNSEIYFLDNKPIIAYSEQRKNKYNIVYDTDRVISIIGTSTISMRNNKTILYDSNANFNSNVIGRDIILDFTSATFNTDRPFSTVNTPTYKVKSIINENYVVLDSNIKLYNSQYNANFEPTISYNVSYTSSYIDDGSNISKPNIKSYMYVQLYNLKPNTGFIESIGLFSKSNNSKYETYNLINKSKLYHNDLMIDSSNIDVSYRIGNIISQSHVDNYIVSSNNTVDLMYDDSIMDNSVTTTYNSIVTSSFDISIGSSNQIPIYNNHTYIIEFDYYYLPDSNYSDDPEMDIIIGGDPIDRNGSNLVVGTINKSDLNRGKLSYKFKSSNNANVYPIFRIKGGKWYISDISIKSFSKYGYNPEHTYCYIEIPSEIKSDDVEFLIEFYNQNNKKSKYYHQVDRMDIDGSNIYINGRDNIIDGTLYIGNNVGGGIQLEQHNNAAIIRTNNFDPDINSGFMLYSGSNPITESSHVFNGMGIYMQTDDNKFFDFNGSSLDINASTLQVNGVNVTALGGGGAWTTFGYIGDGTNIVEGTNGTESIFTITGSHGLSGSLTDTTMSIKLEPIYDYVGSFELEDNSDLIYTPQFKQKDGFAGLIISTIDNNALFPYKIIGRNPLGNGYVTATQYNEIHASAMLIDPGNSNRDALLDGIVYIPGSNFTVGVPLYLSGSGDIGTFDSIDYGTYGKIQYIGTALESDVIRFQPGESVMTGSPPP